MTSLNWVIRSALGLRLVEGQHDHQLIAAIVDHLDGDLLEFARRERFACRSREVLPDRIVVSRTQRALESIPRARPRKERLRNVKHEVVVISVEQPRRNIITLAMLGLHSYGIERVESTQLDLIQRPIGVLLFEAKKTDVRLSCDRENLARSRCLQQIAHQQVQRRLNVGRGNADRVFTTLNELACARLDGETDDKEPGVVLKIRFPRGSENHLLGDGSMLGTEDEGNRLASIAVDLCFGV